MASLYSPTKVFVSEEVFEDNVTVNWIKSTSNSTSDLSGFLLQQRISSDSVGWKAWEQIADIPAVYDEYSYEPSIVRGEYIQFRICEKSISGTAYNSDWTLSDVARKNSLPSDVEALYIDKLTYQTGEKLLLTWSSSSDIDDAVNSYEIQISKNDSFWETYEKVYTLECIIDPEEFGNSSKIKFRIAAIDTLGAKSGYTESGVVYRNDSAQVRVCVDGAYQEVNVYYCKNSEFERVNVYVCSNKSFESVSV
ncbi:MAG: hypothetical protein R3Y33_05060 [Clostridia bacterium]